MAAVEFPDGITEDMTADEALAFTIAFLDMAPDDDTLCRAALTIGEPLIDWHWSALEERLIELLRERVGFRKMVSCCDFDESVPEEVNDRLHSFVAAEDDIGHQPADVPHDLQARGLSAVAPELDLLLSTAPPGRVAQMVEQACSRAIEATGLTSRDVDAGLARLRSPDASSSAPTELIERLRDEADRLMDQAMPFLGASGGEAERCTAAFRRSLALEALAYALDRSLADFASRAVFSAGFATVEPNDTWTRLVADYPSA